MVATRLAITAPKTGKMPIAVNPAPFYRPDSDEEAIRVIKKTAVFDKFCVKKSASVAARKIPSELVEKFSRREFPAFKSREEALAWW
jgi:hypothetical protein